MGKIRKLATLDVAVQNVQEAAQVFQRNFGFEIRTSMSGDEAKVLVVGDSEIRLIRRDESQETGPASRAMDGLWLEAENVQELIDSIKGAGVHVEESRLPDGRLVLRVDPSGQGRPWLFITECK